MDSRKLIGYRYNAVDIHSHFLPGCDDGADDVREAIALLSADREEGVLDVIAYARIGNRSMISLLTSPDR